MTEKRKVGRPRKENAVKAGQLAKGLVRLTFIVDEKRVLRVRKQAHQRQISLKEMMAIIIDHYFKKGTQPDKVGKVLQKNANKLKAYFKNLDTNQDSNS